MDFGTRLRNLRIKKKISQVNLSIYCEVSQESISSYENGKNLPTYDVLIRMCDYLGTTTDYLLGRIKDNVSIYQLYKNDITDEEADIISSLKQLSYENKLKVVGYIEALKVKV